jgi:hypothetical protein
MLIQIRTASLLLFFAAPVHLYAQNLVAYYQIGLNPEQWVKWDTYVIDTSTVVADGDHIRYKSFRITPGGSDAPQEIRVDCKTMRRGLAADTGMYSTYEGALTGEEARVACKLARKLGVLK